MGMCSKCGAKILSSAGFCSNCGWAGGRVSRQSSWLWTGLIAGAAALVCLAWGMHTAGFLISKQANNGSRIGVTADSRGTSVGVWEEAGGPSITAMESLEGGPVLAERLELPPPVAQVTKGRMPEEISKWLDHLVKTHNSLRGINRSETKSKQGAAGALAPKAFPEDQSAEAAADDARRRKTASDAILDSGRLLDTLAKEYRSYPPPAECVPIAQHYDSSLRTIQHLLQELRDVLERLDLEGALSLQGKSRAVEEGISKCNRLIERLCERYGVANQWVLVEDTDFGAGFLGTPGISTDFLREYERLLKGVLGDDGG